MEGARRRLRPVILTASSAALGLAPFLFADGPGAEIQRPLAIVVIGGLVTATALTLLLLPILYDRFALPRAERRRLAEQEYDREQTGEPSDARLRTPPIVTQEVPGRRARSLEQTAADAPATTEG
jgi:cobalt-zinc-cadmium resistance protein CzcA